MLSFLIRSLYLFFLKYRYGIVYTSISRIDRIKELEEKIEQNRAPARDRLQAKLAYEHYEYGPIPRDFI